MKTPYRRYKIFWENQEFSVKKLDDELTRTYSNKLTCIEKTLKNTFLFYLRLFATYKFASLHGHLPWRVGKSLSERQVSLFFKRFSGFSGSITKRSLSLRAHGFIRKICGSTLTRFNYVQTELFSWSFKFLFRFSSRCSPDGCVLGHMQSFT